MAKRKPGGQKGNKNAQTHGMYAAALGPESRALFEHALTIDPAELREEIALMRVALANVAEKDRANIELLSMVALRLTRLVAVQYGMSKERQGELHESFVDLIDQLRRNTYDPAADAEDAA